MLEKMSHSNPGDFAKLGELIRDIRVASLQLWVAIAASTLGRFKRCKSKAIERFGFLPIGVVPRWTSCITMQR